jgi:hypothetical protein
MSIFEHELLFALADKTGDLLTSSMSTGIRAGTGRPRNRTPALWSDNIQVCANSSFGGLKKILPKVSESDLLSSPDRQSNPQLTQSLFMATP